MQGLESGLFSDLAFFIVAQRLRLCDHARFVQRFSYGQTKRNMLQLWYGYGATIRSEI
jgi:hypothetical protein